MSEIDFLVVPDRGDGYLSDAFGPMEKYYSWPKLLLVKGMHLCVITLHARFLIACPEKQTSKSTSSYSF